jgi:hypothetical protein
VSHTETHRVQGGKVGACRDMGNRGESTVGTDGRLAGHEEAG